MRDDRRLIPQRLQFVREIRSFHKTQKFGFRIIIDNKVFFTIFCNQMKHLLSSVATQKGKTIPTGVLVSPTIHTNIHFINHKFQFGLQVYARDGV